MDVPSPQQFDRATSLAQIDYATLRTMLVARAIAENLGTSRRMPVRFDGGTLAERIDFFSGRIVAGRGPRGAFVSMSEFAPKGKRSVYLGASGYGRKRQGKKLFTSDAALTACSGEMP